LSRSLEAYDKELLGKKAKEKNEVIVLDGDGDDEEEIKTIKDKENKEDSVNLVTSLLGIVSDGGAR
jgi:hypothetical protein